MEGLVLHKLGASRLIGILVLALLVVLICLILGDSVPNASPSKPTKVYPLFPCHGQYEKTWIDAKNCQPTGKITASVAREEKTVYVLDLLQGGLDLSRWNQFIFATVELELGVANASLLSRKDTFYPNVVISAESQLGYQDMNDEKREWRYLASSKRLEVDVLCPYQENKKDPDKSVFRCRSIPYFQIDSVYHDQYILNAKFSVELKRDTPVYLYVKNAMSRVTVQSAALTKVFLAIRLVFCPFSAIVLIWYIIKVRKVNQSRLSFFQRTSVALGASLVFLNLPLEWLTLWVDIPCMQLIYEIRLVIFYSAMFVFFTRFLYHNMKEKPKKMVVQLYRLNTAVYPGSIWIPTFGAALILFYIIDRISIYGNYFKDMSTTEDAKKILLSFIISIGAWSGVYCFSLLPELCSSIRDIRKKYQGAVCYTLCFTVVLSLLVGLLTVTYYLLDSAHWAFLKYRWDFPVSGALYTGIYAVWNMYSMCMLVLFATENSAGIPQAFLAETVATEGDDDVLPDDVI